MSLTGIAFIVRHFFLGYDVALGCTWESHDHMAARPNVACQMHVISRYSGPQRLRTAST